MTPAERREAVLKLVRAAVASERRAEADDGNAPALDGKTDRLPYGLKQLAGDAAPPMSKPTPWLDGDDEPSH